MELRRRLDHSLARTHGQRFNALRAPDIASGPFSHLAFTVLWTVTRVSNIRHCYVRHRVGLVDNEH
jgi:hypothetical protein